MSTPFPERFPEGVTLGVDLDLDEEELYLPSGERLTEQRAHELPATTASADRPKVRNWRDVRAEAIEAGLLDEARVADGTAKLREVHRAYRTTHSTASPSP